MAWAPKRDNETKQNNNQENKNQKPEAHGLPTKQNKIAFG